MIDLFRDLRIPTRRPASIVKAGLLLVTGLAALPHASARVVSMSPFRPWVQAEASGQGIPYPPEVREWNRQVEALSQLGNYQEAVLIQEKVLAWSEQHLGPDQPDTTLSLTGLAILYKNLGAYAKAEPLLIRALAINEKALGSNHPNTLAVRENLDRYRKALGH